MGMIGLKEVQDAAEERFWQRGTRYWELAIATLALMVTIGGPLLANYLQLHDVLVRLSDYEAMQKRVIALETWKGQHEQYHELRKPVIDAMGKRQDEQADAIRLLSQSQIEVRTQLSDIKEMLKEQRK